MHGETPSWEKIQRPVEYALIAALVAIVAVGSMIALGSQIGGVFSDVHYGIRHTLFGTPTPVPTATATPVLPQVVIDPDCSSFGGSAKHAWICFTNRGGDVAEMTGWSVKDAAKHRYAFPEFQLKSGASVILHTGRGSDSETDLYWGRSEAVWNDKGDTAYLFDGAGNLVDEYSYGKKQTPILIPKPTPPPISPLF